MSGHVNFTLIPLFVLSALLVNCTGINAAQQLPSGFTATVWKNTNISGGDGIAFGTYSGAGGGTRMFYTNALWGQGAIYSVVMNANGTSGATQLFANGFEDQIVSCVQHPSTGYWYAGHGSKVSWMKDKNGDGDALDAGEKGDLLTGLTVGSSSRTKHATGEVSFGSDGRLYFNVGSKTDAGEEPEPSYQAVMRRVTLASPEVPASIENYATGLRNASGHTWMADGRLVATEHGPDCDFPDELNIIVQGGNYGFPYCYGDGTEQPAGCPTQTGCAGTIKPVAKFAAHTAPIGITQYNATMFPAMYRGNLFVAEFGNLVNPNDFSISRRVSRIIPDSVDANGKWKRFDFFWDPNQDLWQRQLSWIADVNVGPDGALYAIEFSDQFFGGNTGKIYRITFSDNTGPSSPQVFDAGQYTSSPSSLSATWTSASDPESGIYRYWYSAGTSPGATNVKGWTDAGLSSHVTISGMSLTSGQTYYINVRSENGNLGTGTTGVLSAVASSDGIKYAPNVATIGNARLFQNGSYLTLSAKRVSAKTVNAIWLQENDRSAGIRVAGSFSSGEGDTVTTAGYIATENGERCIQSAVVNTTLQGTQTSVEPLRFVDYQIGGQSFGMFTPGKQGGIGLNNVGQLAKIAGVTLAAPDADFGITQGGEAVRIKYETPLTGPSMNAFVTVVGVVRLDASGVYIQPRRQSDIVADSGMIPAAPTLNPVTTKTNNSLTWSWTASPGAVVYEVYTASDRLAAVTASTSWVETGLAPYSSHTRYVRAVGMGGASATSNSISATTLGP